MSAVSGTRQFMLRCGLTLGSLFTGAGIMHNILRPDMVHSPPLQHKPCFHFLRIQCVRLYAWLVLTTAYGLDSHPREKQTLPDISPPEPINVEGFAPAESFAGRRPGFVFKRDVAGVGYYPDVPVKPKV
jgi:hypothetical protein